MRRWLLVLGLCVSCRAAGAQSVADVAEHVPAGAQLAVASAAVGQSCQQFERTHTGQVLCGPEFAPLIEELRRRELAGPLNLRPAFGFDWHDLQDIGGAGGLFVFPLPDGRQGMAWLFAGQPPSDGSGPLAAAARYFNQQRFTSSQAQRGGANLTLFRSPPDARAQEPVMFAAQAFYGIANAPEAVDTLLAVEREQSLAADPLWQRTGQPNPPDAAPRPGDVTLLVRPMQLWELMRQTAEQDAKATDAGARDSKSAPNEEARDPLESSRQLGFDGVTALAGQLSFPAKGSIDWQMQLELLVSDPLTKALRLLELRPGPRPELPNWISADATSATFWRWDFPLAMRGFGNLFDEANEPGPDGVGLFEDMLDGLRDDPEGVQVDLRRDVFEQLGPDIANVTDRRGPQTESQPHGDRTLYVAKVRDVARVRDALSRFYRDDDRVRHEHQGEYDVWTVPEGASLFVEGESDSVVSVRGLALGEGRMLFGTDVELLQSTLADDTAGKQLKDDSTWAELWRNLGQPFGQSAALWGLSRLDVVLEPSYQQATAETVKQDDGLVAGMWRVLLFGTADREANLPHAAAPAFDRVRGALPPAGMVMAKTPTGWAVSVEAVRPADAP